MSTAPQTPLEIVNAALVASGNSPIASFDDGTAEAMVAAENYELEVSAAITSCPWLFASTTRRLVRMEGETDAHFRYAYAFPQGVMEVQRVEQGGEPIAWERASDKILCAVDGQGSEPIVAICRGRPLESTWPADFRLAVVYRLQALFYRALGEMADQARVMDSRADALFEQSKNMDAKRRSHQNPWRSKLLEARFR